MSIRQPKPRQIRLPFNVPKPRKGEEAPARLPKVRQPVYLSEVQCAILLARVLPRASELTENNVTEQIQGDPSVQMEEKRRMLDMLRRFEESAADGDDVMAALEAEEEEDDADDELAAALEGVDLGVCMSQAELTKDNIDANELMRLLPPAHRDAFLSSLRDPDSAEAKALLAAAIEQGEGEEQGRAAAAPSVLPWWEEDVPDEAGQAYAPRPPDIPSDVLSTITPPPDVGEKLVFNVVAVCIAYLHTLLSLRLPSLAPEFLVSQDISAVEVKAEFERLLPFLAERSTVRYEDAREAWGAVWDAAGVAGEEHMGTLPFLLDKAAALLHPPITMEPPRVAGVLADMYRLLADPKPRAPASRKIAFYAVAMGQLQRTDWLAVEAKVRSEAERLRAEMPQPEKEEPRRDNLLL